MEHILENNRRWVAEQRAADPDFFNRLAAGQQPKYLFIGCSDSRVPASTITGTGAGEMFVHRNIANLVVPTDFNLLSVLQYAVEVLEVKVIIVCGHYGCGGVAAAASNKQYGLLDGWLTSIRDVIRVHETEFLRINDEEARLRRLVELNVIEQVRNLTKTSIIQNALRRPNPPKLHGLVYDIKEGLLIDLKVEDELISEFDHIYSIMATEPQPDPKASRPATPPAAPTASEKSHPASPTTLKAGKNVEANNGLKSSV